MRMIAAASAVLRAYQRRKTFAQLGMNSRINVILSAAKDPRRFIGGIAALWDDALDSCFRRNDEWRAYGGYSPELSEGLRRQESTLGGGQCAPAIARPFLRRQESIPAARGGNR